ncbi:MAG: hypothetical protein AAGE59_29930 [Cyanobacteria bacterium P01_F01_bin.86]
MAKGFSSQTQDKAVIQRVRYDRDSLDGSATALLHPRSLGQGVSTSPAFRLRDAGLPSPERIGKTSASLDIHHAEPLAPLREQDAKTLETLFKSDQIQEIVLDVHRYIARSYPEPCWEDEPYEFLHGFI